MAYDVYVFLVHSFCKLKYSWQQIFFNVDEINFAAHAEQLLKCAKLHSAAQHSVDAPIHREQSGWLKMVSGEININFIRVLIEEYHALTCRQIAAIADCSKSTVENIMKKDLCCLCSVF